MDGCLQFAVTTGCQSYALLRVGAMSDGSKHQRSRDRDFHRTSNVTGSGRCQQRLRPRKELAAIAGSDKRRDDVYRLQRHVEHLAWFEDKQKDETIYNIRPNECYKAEARRNSGPEVKERAESLPYARAEETTTVEAGHKESLEERQMADSIDNVGPDECCRVQTVGNARTGGKEITESVKSGRSDTTRKKSWRIRLVDRVPSPTCVNDRPVDQHRLVDDETVSRGRDSLVSLLERQADQPVPDSEDHDCIWKSRLLEQNERLDIQSITVLLHFGRREDVIFRSVDWKGGELRLRD